MKFEIKHRFTGKVLFSMETDSFKLCVEVAVKQNANLQYANLQYADLWYADLRNADLWYADLRNADLQNADLRNANLRNANLQNAKNIKFSKFPTITTLSSFNLGNLSDNLTLELMRRDAYAHPHPEKFNEWANGGNCPYQNENRFWIFDLKKELWEPGNPEMTDRDLIIAICKAKEWKINKYLE